jgi:hypothetical protein
MSSSGRLYGWILLAAGLALGAIIAIWLLSGMREGTLRGSGAIFGLLFAFIFLVAPLLGAGVFFLSRGRAEERMMTRESSQTRLLNMVKTRGQLSIFDVAAELGVTREQIENDLYNLVGLGLFTGYVDWGKGILYSVEANQLAAQLEKRECPCGGPLELAGKGIIKCSYCGTEYFLDPEQARALGTSPSGAVSAGGGRQ